MKNVEDIYPLSPLQQGMLFHTLYAPQSGVYVEQMSCTLRGDLDGAAFKRAWQYVIDRHPVFRTAFIWEGLDEPLQIVRQQVDLPWEQDDWRELDADTQQTRLEALLKADQVRGFELVRAPLTRFTLVQLADDDYAFIWSHHHLLLDGWSLPLVLNEVLACYAAFAYGRPLVLPTPCSYRDYITWLQEQDLAHAEAFWRRYLQGLTTPTGLGVDRPRQPAERPAAYAVQQRRLDRAGTARLDAFVREHGLTLNTLVQGAWSLLLSRYSGETDVVFGATVAGRPPELPGSDRMIGLFINTLPVRARVPDAAPVAAWLRQLQTEQVELRQYEHSPLVQIQGWSAVPRGTPLFESILVFENYPEDYSGAPNGAAPNGRPPLVVEQVHTAEQTNYPLTIAVAPSAELLLQASYDCARFDDATITRLLGHLEALLAAITVDHALPVSALPVLTEAELGQLQAWNTTEVAYPANLLLHQLVAAQVARTPDAIALMFDLYGRPSVAAPPTTGGHGGPALQVRDSQFSYMTYAALDARANQLAHHLQSLGIGPDTLVAVCLERSLTLVVALLGVLKAGGAYLPLDPSYPTERLAFMLADSQAQVLLTNKEIGDWRLESDAAQSPISNLQSPFVVDLDADWETIARQPTTPPSSTATAAHLAYAIYTSGSTGQPKGALNAHQAIVNRLLWMQETYGLTASDHVLQKTPFSFDVSVWEFFWPLLAGARLVLARPEGHRDPAYLASLIEQTQITTLHFVPSMLHAFLEGADVGGCTSLRYVICSGEALSAELQARFFAKLGAELHNLYGPTEAAVDVSAWACERESRRQSVPIGRPIANTQLHILDRQMRVVPIGVTGELYIGGVQLARGYHRRPELTAERFVPNPFAQKGLEIGDRRLSGAQSPISYLLSPISSRLYRTGDLCRYREDGAIEYLGRIDHQVKLRGFRIELGEIEAALRQHPSVREAVVIAYEESSGDVRLIAYLVPGDWRLEIGDSASDNLQPPISNLPQELRRYLNTRLPEYMVPSTFVLLDALPLSPNGKLDRQALPAPSAALLPPIPDFVAPRTPEEEVVAGIWSSVLHRAPIGAHDNFFHLGGHSLLATQVLARLRETFKLDLALRDLFDAPTLAALADRIRTARRAAPGLLPPALVPVERTRPLPLSFAQQRLWFLDQLDPGTATYTIPVALRLLGPLELAALQRSLSELVRRHEVLRTTVRLEDGQPVQVVGPARQVPVAVQDLGALDAPAQAAAVARAVTEVGQQTFDLERGPLLVLRLVRLGEEEHVALLALHHLVADGWSLGLVIEELTALYGAYVGGGDEVSAVLPPLPVQYGDYAVWQRAWLTGAVLERHLAYWRGRLAGLAPLELPTDRPRSENMTSAGANCQFVMPTTIRDQLVALSRQEGVTLFMTLLAAFQVLLGRYSGQDDLAVGTPIANRTRGETEGLIGCFVNTLVLRADLAGDPSFRELLGRVREICLEAYAHQELPFEQVVDALQPERDLSRHPLFQVMFALQNAPLGRVAQSALAIQPLAIERQTTQFDLSLFFEEAVEGLAATLEYRIDLFEDATIDRMAGHLQMLLAGIAADPDCRVSALPLLTEAELRRFQSWNATAVAYPPDLLLHQLVAAQVARTPDAIALAFEDQQLTYAALDARANQLAHHLQSLGVGPDALVAVCLERSLTLVVALLGVLKAGGAYLPLDPSYPAERLQYMLADSQAPVLLTSQEQRTKPVLSEVEGNQEQSTDSTTKRKGVLHTPLAADGSAHSATPPANPRQPTVIDLIADWETIARQPAEEPPSGVRPQHLAYAIYTSGSTGQPKGALNAHQAIVNRLLWMQETYGLTASDHVLQKTPFSFDVSVWEFFWPLLAGARLILARPEGHRDPAYLASLIEQTQITTLHFVPSMLRAFLEGADVGGCTSLRYVICSGEALSAELEARFFAKLGAELHNLYGPTEAAVDVSAWACRPEADATSVPIGRPIANTQLHILDRQMRPVPLGVMGELYIGGVQLARGYLNRPELTAERFVPNPFAQKGLEIGDWRLSGAQSPISYLQSPISSRLYRTGDLCRYREDGAIEYLGRIDHQVKLRGFRIELGEIEAVLRGHAAVREAAVLAREDVPGDMRLVAYIVTDQEQRTKNKEQTSEESHSQFSILNSQFSELRDYLKTRLPDYMIPAVFIPLEALPLTPSGKLDRRALPAPGLTRPAMAVTFVAPRTPVEASLARIWASVLRLEQVGVHDNFFALGGDSILTIQIIAKAREVGLLLTPRQLFQHQTIAGLAAVATPAAADVTPADEPFAQVSDDDLDAILDQVAFTEV